MIDGLLVVCDRHGADQNAEYSRIARLLYQIEASHELAVRFGEHDRLQFEIVARSLKLEEGVLVEVEQERVEERVAVADVKKRVRVGVVS